MTAIGGDHGIGDKPPKLCIRWKDGNGMQLDPGCSAVLGSRPALVTAIWARMVPHLAASRLLCTSLTV
jgi:hypothetical protein